MNERLTKTFNIMISSPSDMAKYAQVVRDLIISYNTSEGISKGVLFVPQDWRNDTRTAYGTSAQSVIDQQITDKADAVIALFGAKFGTPTEGFASGTLSEIERVHLNGGEVITYFGSGKLVDISSIDPSQLTAVREYKSKYPGLYFEFKTKKALETRVLSDLSKLAEDLQKKTRKSLKLYSYKDDELTDGISYVQYDFYGSPRITKLRAKIDANIDIINTADVRPLIASDDSSLPPTIAKVSQTFRVINDALNPRSEITFDEDTETIIKTYCALNGIQLVEDFMFIGDAHYRGNGLQGYSVHGEHEEQRKARALLEVVDQIREYDELIHFLGQFQNLYYVPLVVKNEGEIFADDISIKISVPKECYFDISTLRLQGENIANEVKNFLSVFLIKDNVEIEDMEYGSEIYPTYTPVFKTVGLGFGSTEPGLGHCQDYFDTDLANYYPYVANIRGDKAVYKFSIANGLKQFTAQFLCAMLMFKKPPTSIEYTITSKSFGYEIKDVIRAKED